MSKEPKRNVYVGHRYVPLVVGEWDKTETYEGLSIVTNKGTSYTSKKRVPKGIDILNEEYWVVTGNYNAQIEEYRKDVREMTSYVDNKIEDFNTRLIEKPSLNDYGVESDIDIKESHFDLISKAKIKQNINEENNIIRVSTFNIQSINSKFFDHLIETKKYILDSMVHICGTQEMASGHYFNFERDFTSSVYPYGYFFTSVYDYRGGYGHYYGNGIISSLNISEKDGQLFDMTNNDLEKRSYQRIVVQLNGKKIAIYNTHLTPGNPSARTSQLSQLFNASQNDPVVNRILLGDFNTSDLNDFKQFTDTDYKLVNTGQYNTSHNGAGIDNIIISKNLTIEDSDMILIDPKISDHNLLWADIKII